MSSAAPHAAATGRPKLVLLHGWTMDGGIFAEQCRRLSPVFDCSALDLPGHGALRDAGDLTIDAAADCVMRQLPQSDAEAVILVGWSLGAMVAWNLLARHRDVPVAGLVVVDMSPRILNDGAWPHGIRGLDAARNDKALAAMSRDWDGYATRINAGLYAHADATSHADTLHRIRRACPDAMPSVWRNLALADEREAIGQLRCPMLVIHGRDSRLYARETAEWLVHNAPRASAAMFDHSGHSPHLEEPERFAGTIREFAQSLPASRRSLSIG